MLSREALEAFLTTAQAERNLSPKTIKAYRFDLLDLIAFVPNGDVLRVETETLRSYVLDMQVRGLRETTVKRRLASIKMFYAWLELQSHVTISPAKALRMRFRRERRLPRVVPASSVRSLLQAASSLPKRPSLLRRARASRTRAMIELLFSTAIRSEELVRIDLRDIDLERRTLRISGKGHREREIFLSSDEVVEAIRGYLELRPTFAPTCEAVFVNRAGGRLNVQSVGRTLRQLAVKAGVSVRVSPHMLRHTMATLLIENGADVRSAQELLGHSSIRTTAIYLDVSRVRQKEVLLKFNPRNSMTIGASSMSDG